MTTRRFGRYTVELSNTDKVLFPKIGFTKGDLIDYYERIAETLLPYVKDRPLTMHRFPDGIEEEGFVQQDVDDYFPDWMQTKSVSKEGGSVRHVVCQNTATLVYLANQACITPHVWLSRVDTLKSPDYVVFDLDPPDGDFEPVREAAYQLRKLLDELELDAYVKTTGSRGLHVQVPIGKGISFDEARTFAQDAASLLARRHPNALTTEARKNKRRGRLYLDTTRNAYAQTVVAPYAVRAKPKAPVATPVDWDELGDSSLKADSFTVKAIFRRLARKKDPWEGVRRHGGSLRAARERLANLLEKEGD